MKKSVFSMAVGALLTMGLFASCSSKDGEPVNPDNQETGTLAFTIDFSRMGSRASTPDTPGNTNNGSEPTAAVSNAVPVTSWDNIRSLYIFLYDRNGVVQFADYVDAAKIRATLQADPQHTGKITYTYGNVPSGYYYLTAVANANSAEQAISTKIDGANQTWDAQNVLNNYIFNCRIEHKADAFPIFYQNQVAASGITRSEKAFAEPAEIFMGAGKQIGGTDAEAVQVISGQTVNAEISLTREVSLMRLRLNLAGEDGNTNNADVNITTDGKVDFSQNAVIMIYTLPDGILPMNKTMNVDGSMYYAGTAPYSVHSSVLVTEAINGTRHFYDANPTSGYSENGKIIGIDGDPYKATSWRDIIVMPNDKAKQLTDAAPIIKQNRYLLVISAKGLPGHVTKKGALTEAKTVYWVGYINEPFESNKIREVNVMFRDGGSEDLPERPDNVGNLTVTVSEPQPWDSNIQASKIEL